MQRSRTPFTHTLAFIHALAAADRTKFYVVHAVGAVVGCSIVQSGIVASRSAASEIPDVLWTFYEHKSQKWTVIFVSVRPFFVLLTRCLTAIIIHFKFLCSFFSLEYSHDLWWQSTDTLSISLNERHEKCESLRRNRRIAYTTQSGATTGAQLSARFPYEKGIVASHVNGLEFVNKAIAQIGIRHDPAQPVPGRTLTFPWRLPIHISVSQMISLHSDARTVNPLAICHHAFPLLFGLN